MKKHGTKLLIISLLMLSFVQNVHADDSGLYPQSGDAAFTFPGGIGLTVGTPGVFHLDFIAVPGGPTSLIPGFMFSLSMAMPQMFRDSDYDSETGVTREREDGETTFWAMQAGIPVFLSKNEDMFFAVTPVAGFGHYNTYHNNGKEAHIGSWVYAGGAADFRYKQLFMEAGLCYGHSKNYFTIRAADNISVLCKIGAVAWFN